MHISVLMRSHWPERQANEGQGGAEAGHVDIPLTKALKSFLLKPVALDFFRVLLLPRPQMHLARLVRSSWPKERWPNAAQSVAQMQARYDDVRPPESLNFGRRL